MDVTSQLQMPEAFSFHCERIAYILRNLLVEAAATNMEVFALSALNVADHDHERPDLRLSYLVFRVHVP